MRTLSGVITAGLMLLPWAQAIGQSNTASRTDEVDHRLQANPFRNGVSEDGRREISLPADANPFDPVWLNNYAIEMAGKGWLGVAEQMLNRALKISPDDPVILGNLERLRNWHQVRKSEYRPAVGYEPEKGEGGLGLPAAPPPWSAR